MKTTHHAVRHLGFLLLVIGGATLAGAVDRSNGTGMVLGFTLALVGLMLALDRDRP